MAPAEVAPFAEAHFAAPALAKGYIGPGVLGEKRPAASGTCSTRGSSRGTAWVTGADQPGRHVLDLVAGRDFTADGVIQAAEVRDGDPCPMAAVRAGHRARHRDGPHLPARPQVRGGARAEGARRNGKLVTVTMGSYGVGVSRAVAAIAENAHDDEGLIWPREVAPADVHVVIAGKDEEIAEAGERAGRRAGRRRRAGAARRPQRAPPGVKFTDAELIGVPTIVVVGRGLANGVVEVRDRATGRQARGAAGRDRRRGR